MGGGAGEGVHARAGMCASERHAGQRGRESVERGVRCARGAGARPSGGAAVLPTFRLLELLLLEDAAARALGAVDLVPALIADARGEDGGLGRGVGGDGGALGWVEEGEVGGVEEGGCVG